MGFAEVGGEVVEAGGFFGVDPFPVFDAGGFVVAALPEHFAARRGGFALEDGEEVPGAR